MLDQLMQRVVHLDVQGAGKFIGETPAGGTINKYLRGSQQFAGLRELDGSLRPNPFLIEAGDFTQGTPRRLLLVHLNS